MKKYIYILVALFFSLNSYSQKRETGLSSIQKDSIINLKKESISNETNITNGEYFLKTNSNSSRSVSDGCSGGDFEIPPIEIAWNPFPPTLVSREWNFHDMINTGGLPYGSGLYTNSNPVLYSSNPSSSDNTEAQTYIQWTTAGRRDQTLASSTSNITLPMAISGRGIRLGNDAANDNNTGLGRAEAISKTFTVDQSNSIYYFKYAVVGQYSHDFDTNNDGLPDGKGDAGFFMAQAKNSSGNIIDSYVEIGMPSNPFISTVRNTYPYHQGWDDYQYPEHRFYYRDWTCASLDLRSYVGQQVTVMFINSDCAQGAHTSHAYIDDICVPCKDTEGHIELDELPKDCQKLPYIINGDFQLPLNQPGIRNINIKINLYKNNNLVHSFTPTVSGSSYSLTLTTSMIEEEDCFDIVSVLEFELPNGNQPNKFIKYTKYSSEPLNNNIEGQVDGLNNDICFCLNPPLKFDCCKTPLDIWNPDDGQQHPSPIQSTFVNNTNLSYSEETFEIHRDASIPITELKINVTDIQFEYNYEQCAECVNNPALWGSIISTDNAIGTLPNALSQNPNWNLPSLANLTDNDINQREIIWNNPNGAMLKSGDKFKVSYLLPPASNIPCCATKVKICTKISWKDANCNVCEIYTCSEIELNKNE